MSTDVVDADSARLGLDAARKAHGAARMLVTCAGVAPAMKTVSKGNVPHPLDTYRITIACNLIGTFNMLTQFDARTAVTDGERGVIVNTTAYDRWIGQAAYSATKGVRSA